MYPQENELLVAPNFRFVIESVFPAGNGLTIVQCKQTETLDKLIDFGTSPSTWNVPAAKPAQPGMPQPGMLPQGQSQSAQQEAEERARPIQPVRAISAAEAAEIERAAQMRAQGLIPAQDLEGCWWVCQPIGITIASCIGFYHLKALGPNKVKQVACHLILGLPFCCAANRERVGQTNTFRNESNNNDQDILGPFSTLCCDPGVECTLHTKIC